MSSHYENVNNFNSALEAANKKRSSLFSSAVHTIKKVLKKMTKSKAKSKPVQPAQPLAPTTPAPLSPEELQNLINEALEEQSAALLLVVSPDCDLRKACGFSTRQTPSQQSPPLTHQCCDIMISSSFSLHQLPTIQSPVTDYYYY